MEYYISPQFQTLVSKSSDSLGTPTIWPIVCADGEAWEFAWPEFFGAALVFPMKAGNKAPRR